MRGDDDEVATLFSHLSSRAPRPSVLEGAIEGQKREGHQKFGRLAGSAVGLPS